MLTPEQARERLDAIDSALADVGPVWAEYGSSHPDDRAVLIANQIADLTQATIAAAQGLRLIAEILAPQARQGDFRVVEREDDEP